MNRLTIIIFMLSINFSCLAQATSSKDADSSKSEDRSLLEFETLNISMTGIKGASKIIYSYSNNILVGINDIPKFLYATSNFDLLSLPKKLQDMSFSADIVYLMNDKASKNILLPEWLTKFKKIKTLKLEYLNVEHLSTISGIELQNLILLKCKKINKNALMECLLKFKLKYFVTDVNLSLEESNYLKRNLPTLIILNETDYLDQIKKGTINLIE